MAAELVAGAFFSTCFQVIFEKLGELCFRDYLGGNKLDELKKKLDIKLNTINHVLEEAEIKQYESTHVKNWVDELKHVVYEADQILDEIHTDAMLNKMKAESEPVVTTNVLGFFSSTMTNPYEYRINELLEKLELLADQTKMLGLEDARPCGSKDGLVSWKPSKRPSTTALVDESRIYGRDVHEEELIKFLLEGGDDSGNQVPIISIVGLGGMGKTTLAKLVYNDNKIKEHFDLKAWVYVSESFNDVGVTKAILESFEFSANGENLNLLQHQLQHKLTGKKYLLVLDDIWNGNAACWEDLLRPFNHGSSGSRIIVTTREKEVANVLNSKLFDLPQLDKSDCWSLFETHAFQGRNKCEYPELELIGKKIVNKCGGLPLAVKTLGQLLRRKFSEYEWRKMLATDMGRLSDKDNKVNAVLRLSYHSLPSIQKRCFAYCSIFPKGWWFDKGELINFWMAEGLLDCGEADKSEEELGSEIFNDLESISFLQQSLRRTKGFTHAHYFVMHDLVIDLAKSVSGEFCKELEGDRVEGNLERTRHIWCSLQLNCGDKLLEPICEVKGLRSLILNGNRTMLISSKVQHDLFSSLTCLRMLSFAYCHLSELVDEIGNLKLLRYLDLSDTKITSLPDTICTLYNLQTLLLQGCELTELPSNFSKLINLRHLELPYLMKMPKNMGKLNNFQTLTYFIVEKIVLKGWGNVNDHVDAAAKSNLKDKKYLEESYMMFDGRREEMVDSIVEFERYVSALEALQPNSNFKRLTVEYYKENHKSCPNWLGSCPLPNIVFLKLQSCGLSFHLPPLGQLPWLKDLYISGCDGIKIIGEEFVYDNNNNNSTSLSFRSLEVLRFEQMGNWEEWLCLEGFPLLKELYISECPKLKRVSPQHHPSLQILEIRECNKLEEFLCLEGSPLLKQISISECGKLKRAPLPQHLPSLQELKIRFCEMLEVSIPKGDSIIELDLQKCDRILVNDQLPTSLKRLVLWENQYTEFVVEQNLGNNTILEELRFNFKGFVNCPSLDLRCHNSLRGLVIKGWCYSSLLFELHLFTNLQYLWLYDSPQLESLPRGGLPSNLSELVISNCPKLIASREEWGLFKLNSLKTLRFSDEFENVESFPEENLLPPTLECLHIRNGSKLRIINYKSFLHLNSLYQLFIWNCPSLESLPKEGLPSSLYFLWIKNCPLIKDKYQNEYGHIPHVTIE
ncbi:CC-NBS-LRR resistance protein [Trifolium pratense]|uniref:CC-NBS-LRR resistance protein n=1 Tax=Trifolium pratense TaxID=57577 RepID=A0A2K3PP45_TRIPR|nr:CC-NBS-LRR resistance protein [Trifolium pratense]